MTTTLAEATQHIEIDERGVAYVAGCRSKVGAIAIDYMHNQMSAREIAQSYPHLNLAQVHAALSYYFDHQAEIDRQIQESQADVERIREEVETSEYLERLRAKRQQFEEKS